jgi:hypothetical protein
VTDLSRPATSTLRPRRLTEAWVVAAVFVAGTLLGTVIVQSYRAAGMTPSFYQPAFGPAVMLACGHGLRNPDTRVAPALRAFLAQQDDHFDCATLPANPSTLPLDNFQAASRYLELAVGLVWTILGVSWSRVAALSGLLFGLVGALTYAVLRLGLSRPLALGFLIPAATSTPGIDLLPHVRDYAKGPFLLAIIFILGYLVTRCADRSRMFALSIVAGLVVGIGLGFRTDLSIAVLPTLITLAALVPTNLRAHERMFAIVLFLGAFAAAGWPILRGYAAGGNTGHVVLLGLSPEFDRRLRVEPAIYEFAGQYNDSLAFSIINSYAIRTGQWPQGTQLASREYESAARGYLTSIARVFPADLATRVLAAVRVVPTYFLDSSLSPPRQVRSPIILGAYRIRASIWSRLAPFALPAVVIVTMILVFIQPRTAWLVVVVMFGFAGASALQFHERHFYYLQFVPWFAFGLLAQAVWNRRGGVTNRTAHSPRPILFTALAAATGVAVYVGAMAYQQRAAAQLLEDYERAPRTALTTDRREVTTRRTLLTSDDWFRRVPAGARWIEARVIALEFDDGGCGSEVPVTVRYSASVADADLSEDLVVPLRPHAASPTRLYITAFDRADESIRFRGVEVAREQARCITRVSRVDGLDRTPLLLTARLSEGWHNQRLAERLAW